MIIKVHCTSCQEPVILVGFEWDLNLLERVQKNSELSSFMEFRAVGARVVPCERTDGRTNMKKLTVVFRILTNVTKSISHIPYHTPL